MITLGQRESDRMKTISDFLLIQSTFYFALVQSESI